MKIYEKLKSVGKLTKTEKVILILLLLYPLIILFFFVSSFQRPTQIPDTLKCSSVKIEPEILELYGNEESSASLIHAKGFESYQFTNKEFPFTILGRRDEVKLPPPRIRTVNSLQRGEDFLFFVLFVVFLPVVALACGRHSWFILWLVISVGFAVDLAKKRLPTSSWRGTQDRLYHFKGILVVPFCSGLRFRTPKVARHSYSQFHKAIACELPTVFHILYCCRR